MIVTISAALDLIAIDGFRVRAQGEGVHAVGHVERGSRESATLGPYQSHSGCRRISKARWLIICNGRTDGDPSASPSRVPELSSLSAPCPGLQGLEQSPTRGPTRVSGFRIRINKRTFSSSGLPSSSGTTSRRWMCRIPDHWRVLIRRIAEEASGTMRIPRTRSDPPREANERSSG